MSEKIRIGLADDQVFVRQGFVALLKEYDNLSVIFDVSDGAELLEVLKNSRPDVLLLDIDMPIIGGKETLEQINNLYPEIKVIILTMYYTEEYIREFLKLGAKSFLAKESDRQLVIDAINSVHVVGHYYDKYVAEILARQIKNILIKEVTQEGKIKLSRRESQTLELLRQNKINKEISERLCISERTVEGIRSSLMQKTGAKNLAALLSFALANNLIAEK